MRYWPTGALATDHFGHLPNDGSAKFPEWELGKGLQEAHDNLQGLVGDQSDPQPDQVVTLTTWLLLQKVKMTF